jgi:hypothetical protein
MTGFVTTWCSWRLTLTRQMLRKEQELLTAPEHLRSSTVFFSIVRVAQSLVFCAVFADQFLSFFVGHYIVCLSIYGFWLRFGIFKVYLLLPIFIICTCILQDIKTIYAQARTRFMCHNTQTIVDDWSRYIGIIIMIVTK